MNLFARFFQILRQNAKPYVILNFVYYGLMVMGMVAISAHPAWEQALRNAIRSNFNPTLMRAYEEGLLLPAIYLTFVNNFVLASLFAITLPSLAIPFWGVLLGMARALLWGLALSPTDPSYGIKIIPHSLTALLEGQGYILAMLAAYLLWRNCFWPQQAGVSSHWRGYRLGLQQTAVLYIGVLVLLAVAAIYEVCVAIYLVPALQ